jgi:hypothetical protein
MFEVIFSPYAVLGLASLCMLGACAPWLVYPAVRTLK